MGAFSHLRFFFPDNLVYVKLTKKLTRIISKNNKLIDGLILSAVKYIHTYTHMCVYIYMYICIQVHNTYIYKYRNKY